MQVRPVGITFGTIRLPRWLSRVGSGLPALIYIVLALSPLIALGTLYALSWRVEALIGHWPRNGVDDDSYLIGHPDSLSALMDRVFDLALLMACFGYPLVLALMVVLSYKRASLWPFILWLIYIAGWSLIILDVGGRWAWYMD
jgi:hypothetical protein